MAATAPTFIRPKEVVLPQVAEVPFAPSAETQRVGNELMAALAAPTTPVAAAAGTPRERALMSVLGMLSGAGQRQEMPTEVRRPDLSAASMIGGDKYLALKNQMDQGARADLAAKQAAVQAHNQQVDAADARQMAERRMALDEKVADSTSKNARTSALASIYGALTNQDSQAWTRQHQAGRDKVTDALALAGLNNAATQAENNFNATLHGQENQLETARIYSAASQASARGNAIMGNAAGMTQLMALADKVGDGIVGDLGLFPNTPDGRKAKGMVVGAFMGPFVGGMEGGTPMSSAGYDNMQKLMGGDYSGVPDLVSLAAEIAARRQKAKAGGAPAAPPAAPSGQAVAKQAEETGVTPNTPQKATIHLGTLPVPKQ